MTESEEGILVEYGRRGGRILMLFEPDNRTGLFQRIPVALRRWRRRRHGRRFGELRSA